MMMMMVKGFLRTMMKAKGSLKLFHADDDERRPFKDHDEGRELLEAL